MKLSYRTGTSLQLRLTQGVFSNTSGVNDPDFVSLVNVNCDLAKQFSVK